MLKTNKEKVVKGSVVGKIRPNVCRGWRVAQDGKPFLTPGIGGINYNVTVPSALRATILNPAYRFIMTTRISANILTYFPA